MKHTRAHVIFAAVLAVALSMLLAASCSLAADMPAEYSPVIETYRRAIAERWDDSEVLDEHGIPLVFMYGCDELKLVSSLVDLDADGSPELVIYDDAAHDMIWNAYTIKDGMLVRLLTGAERSRWYLTRADDGSYLLENEGSNHAANSVVFYYALKDGELVFVNGVIYDVPTMERLGLGKPASGDDESETPPAWFTTSTDQRGRDDEYVDIVPTAEVDALALMERYTERRFLPDGEPIVKQAVARQGTLAR